MTELRNVVRSIDQRIDDMLDRPALWSEPPALELQIVTLLEVRGWCLGTRDEDVASRLREFSRRLQGLEHSPLSLHAQLLALGRAEELAPVLRAFVIEQRTGTPLAVLEGPQRNAAPSRTRRVRPRARTGHGRIMLAPSRVRSHG